VKTILDKPLRRFPVQVDWLLARLATPCAYLLRIYRRIGSEKLPRTTRMFREVGIFPLLHQYSDPLFNPYILSRALEEDRVLPGIDLNPSGQLDFLAGLQSAGELAALAWSEPPDRPSAFYLPNAYFSAGDADLLYQVLRFLKPRRMVEIGSGYSTRVASLALERNYDETGIRPVHRCIEPYESERIAGAMGIELITTPIEDWDIDWAAELSAGDLLFIDSSHMIRPQGDVLKEYLEILPQLAAGVYVHIHDIFTPKDYPSRWLQENVVFWNEQYLLEALLSGSNRYEVIAAANFLKHHHFEDLSKVCPYLTADIEPGSFYIRVLPRSR
jgi:hypothetical protein